MGIVTVSAPYGCGGAEIAPAVAAAARAAVPRPGDPGAGRRAARGAGRRGRGQRRDRRPRAVAAGRPRWAPCPTRWAACCRRRRCPTRGPTGSRPSGCWPRSPTARAAWCSAGPPRWCCATGRDALHVRLDGPPDRRLAAAVLRSGRPEDEVRREMEAADRAARGLRAALLPLRSRRGAALPPGDRQHARCRWTRRDVRACIVDRRRPPAEAIVSALAAGLRRTTALAERRRAREEPRRSVTSGVLSDVRASGLAD